jgi:hypothetical protein
MFMLAWLTACAAGVSSDSPQIYDVVATLVPAQHVAGETASVELAIALDGAPELGAHIDIEPWMPDHGHGVSEPPVTVELGEGRYQASWTYPMSGAWELLYRVDGSAGVDSWTEALDVQ